MEFRSQPKKQRMIQNTVHRPGVDRRSSGVTPRQHVHNSAAARRLTFSQSYPSNTTSFYSRSRGTLQSRDDIYVPESPERESVWQPGQTLPLSVSYPQPRTFEQLNYSADNHLPGSCTLTELHCLIQSMQSSIENNFQDVKGRLNELEDRMASIENKHKEFELQHASPVSSSESSTENGRKRRSPPELQHEIRRVHSSLLEDNQLKVNERIDSEVKKIVTEVGISKYTPRQIEDGVKTYRKSLRNATNPRSEEVQQRVRIRSRQQRLFERRAKMVKTKEKTHWKDVTADMMSEEEPDGDEFIRHRPSWRSLFLNRFVTKLENRFIKKHGKSLAKPRRYGSLIDRPAPAGIPSWMKGNDGDKENVSPENDERVTYDSSEELFHGSDNSESSGAESD